MKRILLLIFTIVTVCVQAQTFTPKRATATATLGKHYSWMIRSGADSLAGQIIYIMGADTFCVTLPDSIITDLEKLDSMFVNSDSLNAKIARIHLELIKKFSQETGDSLFANVKELNDLLQQLENALDAGNIKTDTTNARILQDIEQKARRLDSLGNRLTQNLYLLQKARESLSDNNTKTDTTNARILQDIEQKARRLDSLGNRLTQNLYLLQKARESLSDNNTKTDTTNARSLQMIEQNARRLDSLGNRITQNLYLAQANRALLTLANDSSKVGRDDIRIIKGQTDVDTTFNGSKRSKMFLQHDVFTDTLKIDTLYSVTGIVDLGNYSLVGIRTPAYWTAASITFMGSTDGVNFYDIYYQDIEWSMTCTANKDLTVNFNAFYPYRYLRIRSGTRTSAVAQGNRTFTVIAKLL